MRFGLMKYAMSAARTVYCLDFMVSAVADFNKHFLDQAGRQREPFPIGR
jgi:hypothetical protein